MYCIKKQCFELSVYQALNGPVMLISQTSGDESRWR